MMADYARNPETKIRHVVDCMGEFTACGLPLDGDEITDGFIPEYVGKSSNCASCQRAIESILQAYRSARFSKKLVEIGE